MTSESFIIHNASALKLIRTTHLENLYLTQRLTFAPFYPGVHLSRKHIYIITRTLASPVQSSGQAEANSPPFSYIYFSGEKSKSKRRIKSKQVMCMPVCLCEDMMMIHPSDRFSPFLFPSLLSLSHYFSNSTNLLLVEREDSDRKPGGFSII